MSELFDVKNDRRLSVYMYRLGFALWLLYILMGAPFLHHYAAYRTDCALLCGFCMVTAVSASLFYDYHHHPAEFEQKKKWLIVGYAVLAAGLYWFILKK
jgi:hypothetical protein